MSVERPIETGAGEGGRRGAALGWALAGGLIAVLYVVGAPVCPSRHLLELPCLGCGLTRAAVAILSLDLAGAFRMHPGVFVVAPLLGWLAVSSVAGSERVRPPPAWAWIALAAILVAVWALRLGGFLGGHPDL